jgi:hypothetical protein
MLPPQHGFQLFASSVLFASFVASSAKSKIKPQGV